MSAAAGIQAGFGGALGVETLAAIRAQGLTIVRIDLQGADDGLTTALAQEVLDAGLQPLCIIRRVGQMALLPEGALVELGNEPDLAMFGWTRQSYRQEAAKCVSHALISGQRLYVGVVSNLNSRGLAFLNDLSWHAYPDTICCSFHRYPDGRSPLNPHRGSKSRADEMNTLRNIVGIRPLACTEVGYHDGHGGWTEADVADHMAWERRFFSEQGCEIVIGFQVNDGPNTDTESHYGFRRLDGIWKPVVSAFVGAA